MFLASGMCRKALPLVLLAPCFLMSAATAAKATMIARAMPATSAMSSKYHTGLLASLFVGTPELVVLCGSDCAMMGVKRSGSDMVLESNFQRCARFFQ